MSKVHDFKAFMKAKLNESEDLEGMEAGMHYGANPEAEEGEEETLDMEGLEGDDAEIEEEEVTIEDLKAIVDDLEERLSALEGGDEEEEEIEGEEEEIEGEEEEEGEEV